MRILLFLLSCALIVVQSDSLSPLDAVGNLDLETHVAAEDSSKSGGLSSTDTNGSATSNHNKQPGQEASDESDDVSPSDISGQEWMESSSESATISNSDQTGETVLGDTAAAVAPNIAREESIDDDGESASVAGENVPPLPSPSDGAIPSTPLSDDSPTPVSDDTSGTVGSTSDSPDGEEISPIERESTEQTGTPSEVSSMDDDDDDDEDPSVDKEPKKVFNFASHAAGAIVLDKSSTSKGFHNLLDDDKDKYGITRCHERKWVVVGLSEDIVVESVAIANYEKYSSMLRDFQILASASYPTEEWINLGVYSAAPKLGEQVFMINNATSHTRYLRFKFLSHYDNDDALCTLSQVKVHGTTVIASFQKEVKRSSDIEVRSRLLEVGMTDDGNSTDLHNPNGNNTDISGNTEGSSVTGSLSEAAANLLQDVLAEEKAELEEAVAAIESSENIAVAIPDSKDTSTGTAEGDEEGVKGDVDVASSAALNDASTEGTESGARSDTASSASTIAADSANRTLDGTTLLDADISTSSSDASDANKDSNASDSVDNGQSTDTASMVDPQKENSLDQNVGDADSVVHSDDATKDENSSEVTGVGSITSDVAVSVNAVDTNIDDDGNNSNIHNGNDNYSSKGEGKTGVIADMSMIDPPATMGASDSTDTVMIDLVVPATPEVNEKEKEAGKSSEGWSFINTIIEPFLGEATDKDTERVPVDVGSNTSDEEQGDSNQSYDEVEGREKRGIRTLEEMVKSSIDALDGPSNADNMTSDTTTMPSTIAEDVVSSVSPIDAASESEYTGEGLLEDVSSELDKDSSSKSRDAFLAEHKEGDSGTITPPSSSLSHADEGPSIPAGASGVQEVSSVVDEQTNSLESVDKDITPSGSATMKVGEVEDISVAEETPPSAGAGTACEEVVEDAGNADASSGPSVTEPTSMDNEEAVPSNTAEGLAVEGATDELTANNENMATNEDSSGVRAEAQKGEEVDTTKVVEPENGTVIVNPASHQSHNAPLSENLEVFLSSLDGVSNTADASSGIIPLQSSPAITCLELLNFPTFRSKMLAKLQDVENGEEGQAQGNSGSDDNVFKVLMTKIKSLETSQAILELYTSEISQCYRMKIIEHEKLLTVAAPYISTMREREEALLHKEKEEQLKELDDEKQWYNGMFSIFGNGAKEATPAGET